MSSPATQESEITQHHYALPKPKFCIGDRVELDHSGPCAKQNMAFYKRQLTRHEIKQIRRFRTERPMLDFNKNQIRERLNGIRDASCIEVVGVMPAFGLNIGCVANQCYLPGVHGAASALSYGYALCFRWTNSSGDNVAFIPQLAVFGDSSLKLAITEKE